MALGQIRDYWPPSPLPTLTAAAARTGDRADHVLHDPGTLALIKGVGSMGVLDKQSGWIPGSHCQNSGDVNLP